MKFVFLLCVLAIFGCVQSRDSPLKHQTESLETKLFISKIENIDMEVAQWHLHFLEAKARHIEELYQYYSKWLSAALIILSLFNFAYLVLKDVHLTLRAFRDAERNNYEEQQRRIRELKRRLTAMLRNERNPLPATRQYRVRYAIN